MKRYPGWAYETFPRPRPRAVWPSQRHVPPEPEIPVEVEPEAAPVPVEPPISEERKALREASERLEAARGRVERDAQKALDETRSKLLEQLIPVLDSLDRAQTSDPQGIAQIRAQLEGVMRGFGLERFDAEVGAPFDPREHEAMAVTAVDAPSLDQKITAQWSAGYRHAGKLLRPARVQVGRFRG